MSYVFARWPFHGVLDPGDDDDAPIRTLPGIPGPEGQIIYDPDAEEGGVPDDGTEERGGAEEGGVPDDGTEERGDLDDGPQQDDEDDAAPPPKRRDHRGRSSTTSRRGSSREPRRSSSEPPEALPEIPDPMPDEIDEVDGGGRGGIRISKQALVVGGVIGLALWSLLQ